MNLGGAVLDRAGSVLLDARGEAIPLRAQSMKVLLVLAARAGQVVGKDELFEAVWGDVHVTDDSLTQCVGEIRRAVGDARHKVVQTVPKRGYRLVPGPVAEVAAPRAPEREALKVQGRRWGLPLALALAAGMGLAGWSMWPDAGRDGLPSIAVLPFEDLAGEPRWERLGRGLAAEIGADLARSKGVVVIPAETVEASPGGPLVVAKALRARFVLDGTLQAQGQELRTTARLIDTSSGKVVWSDRWTRPTGDLFAVQDEIVGHVGGRLDGTWTGMLARAVREEAEGRPTESLEAYELYLLGAEAKHDFTPDGFDRAADYLGRALEIDPDFVQALVTLSIIRMYQADYVPDGEAEALIRESSDLAERAAFVDPDDPNALIRLSSSRVFQGRRDEAWAHAARAVDLAPTNPDVLATAAWSYFFADHGRAPLDWAERAVALNPGHPGWYNAPLAHAALFAGDLDLARRAGQDAPPTSDILATVAAAEALSGNIEESRRWFARLRGETRYRSISAVYFLEDMSGDPAWAPWVEGALLAGFPVTDAEADALAAN